ncbi:MAG: helix-turn-helix transcriptional regulator [Spirochaetota bacterium]
MSNSTYEREMENPEFRRLMEKERFMLELSETIAKAMEEQHISIRELAKKAHVSKTIVAGIRSGSRKNITLDKLKDLFDVLNLDLRLAAK